MIEDAITRPVADPETYYPRWLETSLEAAREQGFEVTAKELAETIIKMRPESRPYLAPYLALSALEGEL